MFVVRMTTDHYTFEATGLTVRDAKAILLAGWRKHLRQGIAHYAGKRVDTSEMAKSLKMSLADLEDHYGISVLKCEPGVCLRDGVTI